LNSLLQSNLVSKETLKLNKDLTLSKKEDEKKDLESSTQDELETPNILKSTQDKNNTNLSLYAKEKMQESISSKDIAGYTHTRFFDPETLSFKPIVFPNIEAIQRSYG